MFAPIYGTDSAVKPTAEGSVKVTVPPLTVSVCRANKPISTSDATPTIGCSSGAEHTVAGRAEIAVDVAASTFAQTTFLYRPVGTEGWRTIGTDDNAPFRVFHDVSGMPLGSVVEYRAIVRTTASRVVADGSWATVAPKPPPTEAEIGDPITQPSAVSVPGATAPRSAVRPSWAHGTGSGLRRGPAHPRRHDQIWKNTFWPPAGQYSYKAAINKSWTRTTATRVTSTGRHLVRDRRHRDVLLRPPHEVGDLHQEPDHPVAPARSSPRWGAPRTAAGCMRSWLQDPDGDGIFAWATTKIPAGTWEFKVAHRLSWDESYGNGSGNFAVTVPVDGARRRASSTPRRRGNGQAALAPVHAEARSPGRAQRVIVTSAPVRLAAKP